MNLKPRNPKPITKADLRERCERFVCERAFNLEYQKFGEDRSEILIYS